MFYFKPEIDLFSSRLNKQVKKYCSYQPDTKATHVDAFFHSMEKSKVLLFPSFCILQTIQKIMQEQATGIFVIPNCPTKP